MLLLTINFSADREVLREFIKKNVTDCRMQLANLAAKVNKLIAGTKQLNISRKLL